jgi:hypothetical protein
VEVNDKLKSLASLPAGKAFINVEVLLDLSEKDSFFC